MNYVIVLREEFLEVSSLKKPELKTYFNDGAKARRLKKKKLMIFFVDFIYAWQRIYYIYIFKSYVCLLLGKKTNICSSFFF